MASNWHDMTYSRVRCKNYIFIFYSKEPSFLIDVMHNVVKQCFCSSNVHCGSCSHARIQYYPEARNLNGSNAVTCSHVAGPSMSGSGDLFESQTGHRSCTF